MLADKNRVLLNQNRAKIANKQLAGVVIGYEGHARASKLPFENKRIRPYAKPRQDRSGQALELTSKCLKCYRLLTLVEVLTQIREWRQLCMAPGGNAFVQFGITFDSQVSHVTLFPREHCSKSRCSRQRLAVRERGVTGHANVLG